MHKLNISILLLALLLSSNLWGQELAKGIHSSSVLFSHKLQENVACFRIPALVTAKNGDLIAAIDARVPSCKDLRGNENVNIVIRRSLDNGASWSDMETIIDFPDGQSASDPSMILDRGTGEIFLFYNFMDLEKEKDIYYLHVVKSADNGKSWSEPMDITSQITKPGWKKDFKFITSGRAVQTRKGWILHCLVNLNHGMHVFGSKDHGKNWFLIDTPIQPADESKIIELTDGTWMINSRVRDAGMRYVHVSKDEGKTWTSLADEQLIDPACNASIIAFEHDCQEYVLFSNANDSQSRVNMTIRLSKDQGKTWPIKKVIYEGSSAYSTMTILRNGDIGLLFEKDDYSENVFVRFSLDWLMGK